MAFIVAREPATGRKSGQNTFEGPVFLGQLERLLAGQLWNDFNSDLSTTVPVLDAGRYELGDGSLVT